ncbi:MAG: 23S rRNA (guanosine(2251)-2'-O)-methyltransferase RlmB [Thiogranum sp.]|nr:23S rRNA (guanosine(2251)-2'-O)-methyltransferase RlmB [Thiogranum sp.]
MNKAEHVFGVHAVRGVLQRKPERIALLMVLESRGDARIEELLQLATTASVPLRRVSRRELDDEVPGVSHQGVVALVGTAPTFGEQDLPQLLSGLDHPPFLLILDGVQDPHNLGACLRSADAAGVDAVILPKDRSAPLNATVRKVACGAAEAVPVIRVTNLARTLRTLRDAGVWLYGAAGDAAQTVYETDLGGPIALLLGGEGKGLRRLTREHCDGLVSIPMAGSVSSLNVSVATGICLFEARRQRQA